jgi:hypothetical protein
MTHCRYHCRACGGHFASLEAFDAHRAGSYEARSCYWPDSAPLVEVPDGICAIAEPLHPRSGVTIYSTERAARAKEHFEARRSRQAAGANVSEAVVA